MSSNTIHFSGFAERRSAVRIPYYTSASFLIREFTGEGHVLNISPSGIFLLASGSFTPGEIIDIEFWFRHGHHKMALRGDIVRIVSEGLGIKFLWW